MRKKCSICGRVFTTEGKTNICRFCQKDLTDKKRAEIWGKIKPWVISIGAFVSVTILGALFDKLGINPSDEVGERMETLNMDQNAGTTNVHTVWAHQLADINEKIDETEKNLKEARLSLNDSETSLKLAKEGRIYSQQMIPCFEERIEASKQYIAKLMDDKHKLEEKLHDHFENEPKK